MHPNILQQVDKDNDLKGLLGEFVQYITAFYKVNEIVCIHTQLDQYCNIFYIHKLLQSTLTRKIMHSNILQQMDIT